MSLVKNSFPNAILFNIEITTSLKMKIINSDIITLHDLFIASPEPEDKQNVLRFERIINIYLSPTLKV